MVYLISFRFRNPFKSNAILISQIKATGAWARVTDHTWFIDTTENAQQIYGRLEPFFAKDADNVLVIKISAPADYQGWLPEEVWNWLNKRLVQRWR